MASYPSSVWSPSDITDGTILQARLLTDAYSELDAVEQELGLNVHGLAGSVADRLNLFMDRDGKTPYMRLADAAAYERKRMRAGITTLTADDLDANGVATITWSPPLARMRYNYTVYCSLQVNQEDVAAAEAPAGVAWIVQSQTDTSFKVVVLNGMGDGTEVAGPPTSGSFAVHWLLVERLFSGDGEVDLDENTGGSRDDGGHPPGPYGKIGIEDGDFFTAPADYLEIEGGTDIYVFEGFDGDTPAPADFLLTETSDTLVHELTLPADDSHSIATE